MSRKLRHLISSAVSKPLARSRGPLISVKLSQSNSLGLAAEMNGRVRGGGDAGEFLQRPDVLRLAAEFEVADQHAVRIAAEGAVFLFVNLLEQGALVELGRLLHIRGDFLERGVQDPELQARAGLRIGHQIMQAFPRSLQLLELGIVENFVDLLADQLIDLGDPRLDGGRRVPAHGHSVVDNLVRERLDQFLGVGNLGDFPRHFGRRDHLVHQASDGWRLGRYGIRGGLIIRLSFRHWVSPRSM